MSLSAEDIAFVRDLFAEMSDLSTRKMFGGLGLYSGETIFAVMRSDAQILLKAKPGLFADRLSQDGAVQWITQRKNGTFSSMPYWTLPDAALDDPQLALSLAKDALTALEG